MTESERNMQNLKLLSPIAASNAEDSKPQNLLDIAEGLMKVCGENVKECEIADGIVIRKTNYRLLPYVVEMHTAKTNLRVFISEKGEFYTNSRLDDLTFKVNSRTMSVLEAEEVQGLDFEGEFYASQIFKKVPDSLEDGILINVPKGPQEEIQRLSFKKVDSDHVQYRELRNALLQISNFNSSTKN